jgi:2'-5' RNA ligase
MMKLHDIVVEAEEEQEEQETGTFVGVKFSKESCDKFIDIMDKLGLAKPTPREDLHCTVMYTEKPIPDFAVDHPKPLEFDPPEIATISDFDVFTAQDGGEVLVLRIKSKFLDERHKEIIDGYGAEYTHDEYKPHVTLMYSEDKLDLTQWDIEEHKGDLEIASEYNSPLDPEWK